MHDSYVSRDDGCDMVLSDQLGITITATDSSGSKTVDFYLGCSGAAADAVRQRIKELVRSIDRQLDTARWIGQPTTPGAVEKADRWIRTEGVLPWERTGSVRYNWLLRFTAMHTKGAEVMIPI